MLRFKRGEIDLINSLDSEYFDKLAQGLLSSCTMLGRRSTASRCGLTKSASLLCPGTKKLVPFDNFRRAISEAINRADLGRVVFRGHAQAGLELIEPGLADQGVPQDHEGPAIPHDLEAAGDRTVDVDIVTGQHHPDATRMGCMKQPAMVG